MVEVLEVWVCIVNPPALGINGFAFIKILWFTGIANVDKNWKHEFFGIFIDDNIGMDNAYN
jgi:hypothetical protein